VALSEFLDCLFTEGRVRVPRPAEIPDKELREADRVLSAFGRDYRQELPGSPPPVHLPAARWAAVMLHRACQFVAFRDTGEQMIAETMAAACPGGDPPSVHYSVDLTLRYLPDLARLARSASPRDPLLAHLARLAVQWPLSSVGMAGIGPVQIDPWASDPCLLGLYVDRVIARRDTSRLSDRRVREAVQRAVGLFPDLSPEMAGATAGEAAAKDPGGEDVP
jgi:hypothetical protein